jgi:molybdenum cofactor synthesis domain-containing protein
MPITTAAILVIGDEILSGKTRDQNAHLLISELRELGVSLRRIVVIPDDIEVVAAATRELAASHDVVFTSGGIGPTHDDVTIQGIARAFDLAIVRHPELEGIIRHYFKDQVDESHLRMADVPDGTVLIRTGNLSWPVPACRNVYILPGVPEHFRVKFLAIRERFRAAPFHLRIIYISSDEFDIATNLTMVAATHLDVAIGSYPYVGPNVGPNVGVDEYKVKLTLESKDESALELALRDLLSRLDPASIVRTESGSARPNEPLKD